jgi:hypothetical protein
LLDRAEKLAVKAKTALEAGKKVHEDREKQKVNVKKQEFIEDEGNVDYLIRDRIS